VVQLGQTVATAAPPGSGCRSSRLHLVVAAAVACHVIFLRRSLKVLPAVCLSTPDTVPQAMDARNVLTMHYHVHTIEA